MPSALIPPRCCTRKSPYLSKQTGVRPLFARDTDFHFFRRSACLLLLIGDGLILGGHEKIVISPYLYPVEVYMALLFLDSSVILELLGGMGLTSVSGPNHFDILDLVFAIVTLFVVHKFARSLVNWIGQ